MKYLEETKHKIYKTTNYEIFNRIEGNRSINGSHVRKIQDSIKEHGFLLDPIVINENYEVIDGQHRLAAAEEEEVPVFVLIAEGYGADEMVAQNLSQKNWGKKQWLNYYCEKGYPEYIELRRFINQYPFSIGVSIKLMQNSNSNKTRAQKYTPSTTKESDKTYDYKEVFEEGTWKTGDVQLAYNWADNIKSLKKYYGGYKRTSFVSVMISLFRNENFDFDEFVRKLEYQSTALVDCANRDQYLSLIEDIYNFKKRDKVNLRYTS